MSYNNKKIYTCLIVVLLIATACSRRQISQVAYYESIDENNTNVVLKDVQTKLNYAGITDYSNKIEFFGTDTLDWGVDETDAEIVWGGFDGATSILDDDHVAGRNVKVAIIDSGLDYDHEDFYGKYIIGINYYWIGERFGDIGTNDLYGAENYHGTHVAGIIAANDNDLDDSVIGVAPEVDLYIANVYNGEDFNEFGELCGIEAPWIIEAIIWATNQGVDVISISVGQSDDIGPGIQTAIQNAFDAGIIIVAASGNYKKDVGIPAICDPAANDHVIAVGAINENRKFADEMGEEGGWSSCFGPEQELVAPGVNILSTTPGSNYGTSDGTSFAAPMVTGVCALLIEKSRELFGFKLPPEDIRRVLARTAIDRGVPNRDDYYGWGEVNAKLAIDALETDSDGDNLIDILEEYYNTNPLIADSDGDTLLDGDEVYVHKTDPNSQDSDNDNIPDNEELNVYGTDPNDNDSDDDSMPDGWEVDNNLNPLANDSGLDPDGDGLTNFEEYTHGTDPHDTDTDNDGLSDGQELNPLNNTDPTNPDTDGDGLSDGQEVYGVDVPGLGLRYTDPTDSDTDNDGLTDGQEVNGLVFGDHGIFYTDPINSDSDGDESNDRLEWIFGTNPFNQDTDNDGYTDYEEFCAGTDPNDPLSKPGGGGWFFP